MNATQIKNILLAIPKENFIVGDYSNEIDSCCSLGHINRLMSPNPNNYSKANCMRTNEGIIYFISSVREFMFYKEKTFNGIVEINDGGCKIYNEHHPKDRMLHLLDDMIQAGY